MRRALILLWAVAAGAAEYDSAEVLKRGIQKILDSTHRIPNYTCVETVTRDYLEPAAVSIPRACAVLLKQRQHPTLDLVLHPVSRDRLRLDVTMSSRGEIFSWAGAGQFVDADVDHVVHTGPLATGSFGAFLVAIFETDAKQFNFDRAIEENGRTLLEYTFQVAQPDSHYHVKYDVNSWMYVPYSGSFRLDAATAELVSLKVSTSEAPPAALICLTATDLEFERVRIGEGQFLMPRRVSQRFVYPDAEETENTTTLSNCREFRGQSTVTFAPRETPSGGGVKAAIENRSLLPGVRFTMALTAPIAADTAAAGDTFVAKLTEPARDSGGKSVAPAGAAVEGRLLRVQTFTKPPETVFVLKPEAVWVRGVRTAINAVRDWTYQTAQARRTGKGVEIILPLRGEENAGAFHMKGGHVTLPAGFKSDWKTVAVHTEGAARSGGAL